MFPWARCRAHSAERSRAALAAGCDVVLHCNGDLREMTEVASVVPDARGRGRSARGGRAVATLGARNDFDVNAARELFARLMGEQPQRMTIS